MNPYEPIESFDYFIGKVCTIHVRPTSWQLKPQEQLDYFCGIVNSVSACGCCITNVINHKKTFIMTPHIVAIAEETLVQDQKEHEETFKEYQEQKKEVFKHNPEIISKAPVVNPKKPITKINDSPFVDIESITAHARAAKERMK